MATQTTPPLAAPGAGLPPLEHVFANALFFLYRLGRSRQYALDQYNAEAQKILVLVRSLNARSGATPVLINRIMGIEDSSRFWSPYMVLHHLIIVDSAIIGLIEALVAGRTGLIEAKIADVKPDLSSGPAVVAEFERTVMSYGERLSKIEKLSGTIKHRHPWFGALDAHGWHCLAAVHHTIHRRQLEAIISLRSFWENF